MRATIKTAGDEANKLVATFGSQGSLLIEKLGAELRVTADETFKSFFGKLDATIRLGAHEAQITIDKVGEQSRLVIRETGLETRLTIDKAGRTLEGVVER